MTKQKTIPELQAEIAANERQLAQLQHKQQQLENRRSYYEKGDRRKRAQTISHPVSTWWFTLQLSTKAILSLPQQRQPVFQCLQEPSFSDRLWTITIILSL